MENLPAPLRSVVSRVSALDGPTRLRLGSAVALSAALGLLVWGVFLRDRMVPLDAQPRDADARAQLIERLEGDGHRVVVQRGTHRILVRDADKARIETVYGALLQRNNPVGFELFDDNDFGGTQRREHIRYMRAKQGEIERGLNEFDAVVASKVLLSLPERALFEEDRIDPSAAVTLELSSPGDFGAKDGENIARFVANAVEGLRRDRVEVTDSKGRVLHAASGDEEQAVGGALAELKYGHEQRLQKKVSSMLDELLGAGRSSVRVAVDIDHSERFRSERDLDPEKVVTISSSASETESNDGDEAEGVAGTDANVPEKRAEARNRLRSRTSSQEQVNSDVPVTRETEASAPGAISRITAAIGVDGHYDPPAAAAEGATEGGAAPGRGTYRPRTDEELAVIASLVAKALGTPVENVQVVSHEFPELVLTPPTRSVADWMQDPLVTGVARWSLGLLALLLTYSMVLGPVVKRLTLEPGREDEVAEAELDGAPELAAPHSPQAEAFDLEAWLERVATGDRFVTPAEVSTLVRADLDNAVATLQDWISLDQETRA